VSPDSAIAPQSLKPSGGNHVSTHSRGTIVVAILGTIGFAAASGPVTRTRVNGKSATDRQPGARNIALTTDTVGEQAQVGKHVPDSMSPQAMPNNVTDQVPETKNLSSSSCRTDPVDRSRQQAGDPDRHGRQFEHHRLEYRRIEHQYFRWPSR